LGWYPLFTPQDQIKRDYNRLHTIKQPVVPLTQKRIIHFGRCGKLFDPGITCLHEQWELLTPVIWQFGRLRIILCVLLARRADVVHEGY